MNYNALDSERSLSVRWTRPLIFWIVPLTAMPGVAGRRGAKRLILKRFPYSIVSERSDETDCGRIRPSVSSACILAQSTAPVM